MGREGRGRRGGEHKRKEEEKANAKEGEREGEAPLHPLSFPSLSLLSSKKPN